MWRYLVLVVVVKAALIEASNEFRLVTTAQGVVRGHLHNEGGVYTFYNIPYATAPTGTNRFKAPLAPPVWINVFDAVDRGILCPTPAGSASNVVEDCLVANVFVPDTQEKNLPVLIQVHGGAYQYGFGDQSTYNDLVRTKKLIVVTFNYRLGAHGFLCLGTEGAPGNAGMKDQVALLRWVKTNIAGFGGNPDDVTIMGCSAGGSSVDILTLSETTKGLFNKAIMSSGVAFGGLGMQVDPIANAQTYAKTLNFENVEDLDALEEFYKTASFQDLFSQHAAIVGNQNGLLLFSPCIERDVGEERVLPDSPINIITQGKYNKVPLLFGFADKEGLMRIEFIDSWRDKMNTNFADFLPGELHFETEEDKQNVAKTVKEFYFGDKPVSEENVLSYIDYFTDTLFGYAMLKSLKHRMESLGDTVYLYEYSFVDENSPSIPYTDEKGADHCDQSYVITDEDTSQMSQEYVALKAIIKEYTLNFILTGSPSSTESNLVSWPPANADRSPYMSVGRTIELKNEILLEKRVAFWDGIYEKYYIGPKIPAPPGGSAASIAISKTIAIVSILFYYSV